MIILSHTGLGEKAVIHEISCLKKLNLKVRIKVKVNSRRWGVRKNLNRCFTGERMLVEPFMMLNPWVIGYQIYSLLVGPSGCQSKTGRAVKPVIDNRNLPFISWVFIQYGGAGVGPKKHPVLDSFMPT